MTGLPLFDAEPQVLLLPGIGNSGPEHWQTLWEQQHPNFQRVVQRDWKYPEAGEWWQTLQDAVQTAGPNTVLVAHSLACLTLAQWAAHDQTPIRAAMLVAVPDPLGPAFPPEATGFTPLPTAAFSFPSVVVSSSNDPYGSPAHAERCAAAWGSRLVNVGAAGHINAASGLGDWPEGYAILQELIVSTR